MEFTSFLISSIRLDLYGGNENSFKIKCSCFKSCGWCKRLMK